MNATPLKERQYAYWYLAKLVDAGILMRPKECQSRGRGDTVIYGHHADYSKADDVMWLCGSCHKKEHVRLGEVSSQRQRRKARV